MSARHDLERRLADYYAAEAPARAPDWLLGTALSTIDDTPQRRAPIRVPWRFPYMNTTFAKVAVAAVAAVAVGAIGFAVLRPGPAPSVGDASPSPSTPSAPASPSGSTPPLTETFTSSVHGISISYPTGWQTRAATELWPTSAPAPQFGDPFSDVAFDDSEEDLKFIGIASQALAGRTTFAWVDQVSAEFGWGEGCPALDEDLVIDGAPGRMVTHCPNEGVLAAAVATPARGYLVVLYGVNDPAWFGQILTTARLNPTGAVAIAADFRRPFTYRLPAGAEFDVPNEGYGSTYFEVRIPAAAEAGTPSGLIVQAIGGGRADPCDSTSGAMPIEGGPQAVIDYLRSVPDVQVTNEIETTVDGASAVEATVTLGEGTPDCPEVRPWAEGGAEWVPRGIDVRVIAVDVDGEHIVLTTFGESVNPEWDAMADELIGSIRFQ